MSEEKQPYDPPDGGSLAERPVAGLAEEQVARAVVDSGLAADLVAELARLRRRDALVGELVEALDNVVTNAVVVPDESMQGATDCYRVPLDDIEQAGALLARAREEAGSQDEPPKESFFQKHYDDPPTMASLQRQLEELLERVTEMRERMEERVAAIEDIRRVVRGIAGMRQEGSGR